MSTRWRCRRCCYNIPASLYGKKKQAVAAKSGDWSAGSFGSSGDEEREARSLEAENKELGARIDAVGRKEHKRGQVSPLKTKGTRKKYGGTVWKSRMTLSVAENWRNRGKMQWQPREVERLSFAGKEVQENLVESLQHQLQEV